MYYYKSSSLGLSYLHAPAPPLRLSDAGDARPGQSPDQPEDACDRESTFNAADKGLIASLDGLGEMWSASSLPSLPCLSTGDLAPFSRP